MRNASLAAAALSVVVAFTVLGSEIVRQLRLLESAASDNVQWTLSQAEVEFLGMEIALEHAVSDREPDLGGVRLAFDIFYSRMQTLAEGALYAELRREQGFSEALDEVLAFLETGVPIIDAPDETLGASLADLEDLTHEIRQPVRDLATVGLAHFARLADARRASISETLLRLALVTLVLLSILLASVVMLFRLYRTSARHAEAVQRSSARVQTIVSTSLDGMIVADRMGRIVEFNTAAETIFGQPREAVIGRRVSEVMVPEKSRAAHEAGLERYRQTGVKHVVGSGRVQLEAMRANGTLFPAEMSIQAVQDGEEELFVAFIRDITRRATAERELVNARDRAVAGEEAKAEFIAVMSHEMRTPLNGLMGTLSLLRDTRLTARQRDYVANMEESGALLLHHINDVLDISKYEAGRLTAERVPVDLSALVQEVVNGQRNLAAAAENVIEWQWCGAPVGPVMTDPGLLRQVLLNLVGNAVKFTRAGRIRVEIEAAPGAGPHREITMRVIDTGIGIDPADISRLFEDFQTGDASYGRQWGGTGLGLGIARRLTRALGGEIGAESTPGEGSVFWVALPLELVAAGADRPEPAPPPRGAAPAGRRSVLVIEDNDINRAVLCGMLRNDGHDVAEARNGREGVHLAEGRAFDLVLMDVSMPVMDGIEATQAIRAGSGPSRMAPIYAVTAHVMPSEAERFKAQGINGVLAKPVERAALRALVEGAEAVAQANARAFVHHGGQPLLDGPRAAELARELGTETVQALLSRFIAEGEATVTAIAGMAGAGWNAALVAEICHKLAGTAAVFGATALHERLAEIEARSATLPEGPERSAQVGALVQTWADTRHALEAPGRVTGPA